MFQFGVSESSKCNCFKCACQDRTCNLQNIRTQDYPLGHNNHLISMWYNFGFIRTQKSIETLKTSQVVFPNSIKRLSLGALHQFPYALKVIFRAEPLMQRTKRSVEAGRKKIKLILEKKAERNHCWAEHHLQATKAYYKPFLLPPCSRLTETIELDHSLQNVLRHGHLKDIQFKDISPTFKRLSTICTQWAQRNVLCELMEFKKRRIVQSFNP